MATSSKEEFVSTIGRTLATFFSALGLIVTGTTVQAEPVGGGLVEPIDWPSLATVDYATNLAVVTHIANANDNSDRLFLAEKTGRIRILQGSNRVSTPFLDISSLVSTAGEDGLFSIAFSPDFETSQQFYVNYSRKSDGAVVLSRFRAGPDPDVALTNEQVLVAVPHAGALHNGGLASFGLDGFLYMGVGDQGDFRQSQNPGTLLGKILRIDVSGDAATYTVPSSNPFVNREGYKGEIWAFGLRNPWRSTFDPETGDFYIADVGEASWEEINYQQAGSAGGQNYGWPFFEGSPIYPFGTNRLGTNITESSAFTFPVAEYDHSLGRAVTGGLVYRGAEFARMRGIYFFSDHSGGRIWGLKKRGGKWERAELLRGLTQVTTFGTDEAGNLYAAVGAGPTARTVCLRDERRAFAPTFENPPGPFYGPVELRLDSLTPNSFIHYRRDGLEPTKSDPYVRPGESVLVTSNQVLTMRTFRDDLQPSSTTNRNFGLTVPLTFDPPSSPVTDGTLLTIKSSAPEVIIRYTLDGTDVTGSSAIYAGPIQMTGDQTVKALGVKENWYSQQFQQYYGFLVPEIVAVRTYAGSGIQGYADGPANEAMFSTPYGVGLDGAGNLLVADSGNRSVRKISVDGVVSTVPTGDRLELPIGLAVDPSGNIFVSDWALHKILKISLEGALDEFVTNNLFRPRFLEVDTNGNVFVAVGQRVERISPEGIRTELGLGSGSGYSAVGLSRQGAVFTSSFAQLYQVSESGGELFAGLSNRHIDGPRLEAGLHHDNTASRDIAVDESGNIFFTDGKLVRKITPDGEVRTLVTRSGSTTNWPFRTVQGITLDQRGNIYVADTQGRKIRKVAPDSDADGILDTEEGDGTQFVEGQDDRLIDSDGDGINNAAEYILGTDPTVSNPPFAINLVIEGDEAKINWSSARGRAYRLQRSLDLRAWAFSGEPMVGSGTTLSVAVNSETDAFYRIIVEW